MSWAAQTDGLAADQKRIDSGEDEGDDDDGGRRRKDFRWKPEALRTGFRA